MRRTVFILTLLALVAGASPATACDLCAVYQAVELRDSMTGVRLGVAQQYTHFSDLLDDGEQVDNPHDERLDSSITQFLLGYQLWPELGFQLNLPFISRHYRRVRGDGIDVGDQTGVGDLVVSMRYRPLLHHFDGGNLRLGLLAGVELPSGDSDLLAEEAQRPSDVRGPWNRGRPRHGGSDDPSGLRAHDLALGSGSLDGVFGGDLFVLYERFHLTAMVQYRLRNRGAFGYEYADEVIANVAPGLFLLAEHDATLALRGQLMIEDETSFTTLFAGPALQFTWGSSLNLDFAVDLPVVRETSGLQIVPEYRFRAALSWLF